jgi:hypothetical protein
MNKKLIADPAALMQKDALAPANEMQNDIGRRWKHGQRSFAGRV